MLPLRDHTPAERFPWVNYMLIAANILVFVFQLLQPDIEAFIYQFGFVPSQFSLFNPLTFIPIFTSMFVHGGILHILSNMWFLHIFGDNVEGRFGHLQYMLFYLLSGIGASMLQFLLDPTSSIPMVGASGAISGVAGAYVLLFHASKIETLIPLGFFFHTALIPSWLFLGYWFIVQVFSGFGSLAVTENSGGGVAWFAHIGGFLTGILLVLLYRPKSNSQIYS